MTSQQATGPEEEGTSRYPLVCIALCPCSGILLSLNRLPLRKEAELQRLMNVLIELSAREVIGLQCESSCVSASLRYPSTVRGARPDGQICRLAISPPYCPVVWLVNHTTVPLLSMSTVTPPYIAIAALCEVQCEGFKCRQRPVDLLNTVTKMALVFHRGCVELPDARVRAFCAYHRQ
jgi:hypothetical protein